MNARVVFLRAFERAEESLQVRGVNIIFSRFASSLYSIFTKVPSHETVKRRSEFWRSCLFTPHEAHGIFSASDLVYILTLLAPIQLGSTLCDIVG